MPTCVRISLSLATYNLWSVKLTRVSILQPIRKKVSYKNRKIDYLRESSTRPTVFPQSLISSCANDCWVTHLFPSRLPVRSWGRRHVAGGCGAGSKAMEDLGRQGRLDANVTKTFPFSDHFHLPYSFGVGSWLKWELWSLTTWTLSLLYHFLAAGKVLSPVYTIYTMRRLMRANKLIWSAYRASTVY